MSEAVTLFISLVGPIMIDALIFFFFQAEDGIRDDLVTGVQTVLFRSGGEDFSDARLKSKSSPPDNSAFPKTPKNLSPSLCWHRKPSPAVPAMSPTPPAPATPPSLVKSPMLPLDNSLRPLCSALRALCVKSLSFPLRTSAPSAPSASLGYLFPRLFFTSLLLCLITSLSGCNRGTHDPSSLTFLIESNPANLDPRYATDAQSQRIHGLLFSSLLQR